MSSCNPTLSFQTCPFPLTSISFFFFFHAGLFICCCSVAVSPLFASLSFLFFVITNQIPLWFTMAPILFQKQLIFIPIHISLLIVLVLCILYSLCTFGVSADQCFPQKEFVLFCFLNSCFLNTSFSFFFKFIKILPHSCKSFFFNRHSYSASQLVVDMGLELGVS